MQPLRIKPFAGKALLFATVFVAACKKDNTDPKPTPTPPAPSYKKEILVAPYPAITTSNLMSGDLLSLTYEGDTIRHKKLSTAAINFHRWIINGNIRYSYLEFDPQAYRMQGVGYINGPFVILDSSFNELKRVNLRLNSSRTLADPNALDGHDFILLGDNHYIAMAYFEKKVNNIPQQLNPAPNCPVVAPIIQEVKNNAIVWEWDGTEHPELYTSSVEGNTFSNNAKINDYAHINSMFVDPKDGNIICSFRNIDQIIKINRKDGSIMWRLGGKNSDFALTEDQKFLRQHHATYIGDNTVLIFDNGDQKLRPYSRIVEFELDEVQKTVRSFKETKLPGSRFCQYMGSVQRIGDTYFIGGGSYPEYLEVSATTGELIYARKIEGNSYRAFKY